MTPKQREQVTRILGAVAALSAEERDAFLGQECGGDAEVRTAVELQLQWPDPPPDFLKPPVPGALWQMLSEPGKRDGSQPGNREPDR